MIRIGCLGAGRIGKIHGLNAAKHANATLVAVSDPMAGAAEALAATAGAEARSAEAIIGASDIDAVLICTPTTTHADYIEAAAKAGKAVFCEKPIDLTSDRIRACLAVVKQAGTPLMIGFNRRFDPNFAELKRRIDAGVVGNVELVTVLSRDPNPPHAGYVGSSGGLFRDMMIHDLDMARFLLGEDIAEVHAVGSSLVDPEIGREGDVDTAAVLLKTPSGRIAQISNSRRATYGYDQRIEVHGSAGLIRAGNVHRTTVEVATGAGFNADPVQDFFLERYAEAYRLEMDAFVTALVDKRSPAPTGEDGLIAQVLADAATEACFSGKPVKL